MSKAPRYWKFLDDASVLPMTASRKYIRNGLATVLAIEAETFDAQTAPPKGVARLSSGLSGLRYVLSVGVMFNHIGAVWQGEDERNPMTWGQNFFPGKASTFYFPATAFFVLGGYSLSAALAAREVKSYWSFVSSRFKTLLPLYWFALVLALINLLVTCRPETYSDSFSWQPNMETRTLSDGSYAQCQSGPVELPYGWWLFLTLLVFFTGMQAWFFAFILAGTIVWVFLAEAEAAGTLPLTLTLTRVRRYVTETRRLDTLVLVVLQRLFLRPARLQVDAQRAGEESRQGSRHPDLGRRLHAGGTDRARAPPPATRLSLAHSPARSLPTLARR